MNGEIRIKTWQAYLSILITVIIIIASATVAYTKIFENEADFADHDDEHSIADVATIEFRAEVRATLGSLVTDVDYVKRDLGEIKLDFKEHSLRGGP